MMMAQAIVVQSVSTRLGIRELFLSTWSRSMSPVRGTTVPSVINCVGLSMLCALMLFGAMARPVSRNFQQLLRSACEIR